MTPHLVACFLLTLAQSAKADALIDYRVLFETHAEAVVVTDNGGLVYRNLDLGDGIISRCKGADGYDDCVSIIIAEDAVAPDCLLASTAYALILTQRCETGTAVQRQMLEKSFEGLGQTVARNAAPARDWAELRQFVLDKVEPEVPLSCENMDRRQLEALEQRLGIKEIQRIQLYAAMQRLPAGRCLD
jgi:hypothetical protein